MYFAELFAAIEICDRQIYRRSCIIGKKIYYRYLVLKTIEVSTSARDFLITTFSKARDEYLFSRKAVEILSVNPTHCKHYESQREKT